MSLFSYFQLGLQSMSVARLGLQVTGDNISNVFTPGYVRRRLELTPGLPVAVPGGQLDHGVDVAGLRRMQDRFLQASLTGEQGKLAGSEELLRGLGQLETVFGQVNGEGGIAAALAEFSSAFTQLAANPESAAHRGGAITSADTLARTIRDAYTRLGERRQVENQAVGATVQEINTLAEELASLNKEISQVESSGDVAAPLRDKRDLVLQQLTELTGGSPVPASNGRVSFSLSGGPTLVTELDALPLETTLATDGTLRVLSGADGTDITDRIREGRLGSLLYVRDDAIPDRQASLDDLAADLITQANALTTAAFDLQGNPGVALFRPEPAPATGAAGVITVNQALLQDSDLLAISSTGAPGESDVALLLADLPGTASAALGGKSASVFFSDVLSKLGNEVAQADVAVAVSVTLVETMEAQRDAVSGVSLDEEAVALVQFQQSFEAAARFIDVINNVTQISINLLGR